MDGRNSQPKETKRAIRTEGNKALREKKLIYRSKRRKRRGTRTEENQEIGHGGVQRTARLPAATELSIVTIFEFPVWKGVDEDIRGQRIESEGRGRKAEGGEMCRNMLVIVGARAVLCQRHPYSPAFRNPEIFRG